MPSYVWRRARRRVAWAGAFLFLCLVSFLGRAGCQLRSASPAGRRPPEPMGGAEPRTPAKQTLRALTNSLGMTFVEIPVGTFRMGREGFSMAFPVHEVHFRSFWLCTTETTNAQYDLFKKRQRFPESPSPQHPATRVTWNDCVAFCQWLSKKEGRPYRLPTEAEWEYAARGGLDQKDYPWGNQDPAGRACFGQLVSMPVGSFAPNGYGLYDMSGNAMEWVNDWFDDIDESTGESSYYRNGPRDDPPGPEHGVWKVERDGSYDMWQLYVFQRVAAPPDNRVPERGFRVAISAVGTTP